MDSDDYQSATTLIHRDGGIWNLASRLSLGSMAGITSALVVRAGWTALLSWSKGSRTVCNKTPDPETIVVSAAAGAIGALFASQELPSRKDMLPISKSFQDRVARQRLCKERDECAAVESSSKAWRADL